MPSTLTDLFGNSTELTASIQRVAYKPGRLAALKLFSERGIATTSAFVEFQNNRLDLVPSAPRGGVAQPYVSGSRDGIEVDSVHLPTRGSVMADEAQNVRGFGGNDTESPEDLRTRKLAGMRGNLEYTIENHRLGALKGHILDADGSTVLLDVYAAFGITQETMDFELFSATTNLLIKLIDAERLSEDALAGVRPSEFLALSSPSFMDALRRHPFYGRTVDLGKPSEMLADYRGGIRIANTTFVEHRTPVGTAGVPVGIGASEAMLVPLGVPDLCITRFAPADYVETVNTTGLPIYAKGEALPMGKGFALEAQSNVINLCTRPGAIIKLVAGV